MANVKVKGKMDNISKEELRAMVGATSTVLEYHNKKLFLGNTITVKVVPIEKMPIAHKSKNKSKAWGTAQRKKCLIKIVPFIDFQQAFTIIIHEVIHLYIKIADDHIEKATDLLTNRLKETIFNIYENLIKGVYQRAGYLAHVNISYKTESGVDAYDKSSWKKIDIDNIHGEKLRKKNKSMELI